MLTTVYNYNQVNHTSKMLGRSFQPNSQKLNMIYRAKKEISIKGIKVSFKHNSQALNI